MKLGHRKNKLVLDTDGETCKYHIDEKKVFPVNAHILKVEMGQGNRSINRSALISGGSYLYHVFTVHVDGSNLEYNKMTLRGKVWPQVGDYPARWDKKNGNLDVLVLDRKNAPHLDTLFIGAEEPISEH